MLHDRCIVRKRRRALEMETGDGVDDSHYEPATHLLYVGAARATKLTIARAGAAGKLTIMTQVATQNSARNGVVTKDGTVSWLTMAA